MAYFVRRFVMLCFTLIFVSLITFFVFQILPGDPVRIMLGPNASEAKVETIRIQLGLNQPFYMQYLELVKGFFTGDMGTSIRFSRPVEQLIASRLPVTLSLAILSLILVIIFSIPLGIFTARRENTWLDFIPSSLTQFGMAIPTFFVGLLLMILFGVVLQVFSIGNYVPWHESFLGALGSLILPAITIAIPQTAVCFRYVRASFLDESKADYARTAKGKGVRESFVLYKHVLKNAMIPVLTIFGLILAEVIAGTIVVEQVFSLPGIGKLLISSVKYRDFPVVEGIVMYIAVVIIVINFIVDMLYAFFDPRITLK